MAENVVLGVHRGGQWISTPIRGWGFLHTIWKVARGVTDDTPGVQKKLSKEKLTPRGKRVFKGCRGCRQISAPIRGLGFLCAILKVAPCSQGGLNII